jgi:3-hydroxyacyl-CoA dehydrogenase
VADTVVRLERDGACAVIIIDNPPVNVGSHAVRQELLSVIALFAKSEDLRAAIIIGAGKTFVSGSDIKEFGKPLVAPEMPAVLAAIASCPKPIIAALHGTAMGGGFEIALACDGRIAASSLQIALPEVKLGIIPGAGGTQRVPRLAGLSAAIQLITSGKRLTAPEALALNLIDAIASNNLRSDAIAFALAFDGKRDLAKVAVPAEPPEAIDNAVATALKKAKGRPFITKAVEAILWSAKTSLDEGLQRERAAFQGLRVSEEAAALRALFFAEREAARHPMLEGVAALTLESIAVVGAGTMGTGIATAMVEAGYKILLVDKDVAVLVRAMARIKDTQARALQLGRVDQAAIDHQINLLTTSTNTADVSQADLVIEAVFEDEDLKKRVMIELDHAMKPHAILATNTSYLDVDRLAAATNRPAKVLGLHFFSPANIMRLLEVVRGASTSAPTLATGFVLGRKLNKISVLAGTCEGFIGNRIYNAYRNQCEFMLEDGALPHEVDTALEDFGFAMGPFRVSDLSGLDIAWATRKRQAVTRDPRKRYVAILDALCETGRLGQKTKAGWYRYSEGSRKGEVDPDVTNIIVEQSKAKGMTRRSLEPTEIVSRALGAMINEAGLLLAEGMAQRPSDIDLVMVHGYGFPDYKGGPLFWASQRDPAMIVDALDRVEAATGFGFRRAGLDVIFARPL